MHSACGPRVIAPPQPPRSLRCRAQASPAGRGAESGSGRGAAKRAPAGGRGGRAGRGGSAARAPPKPRAPPPPPRLVTLRESGGASARALPCLLRRSLTLPSGALRALLTPLDAAAALLRCDAGEDYSEVESESEVEAVWAAAAQAALLQRGLLLQRTPFSLTLRGALAYNEEDVLQLEEGPSGEEALGVEVCSFLSSDAEYLLYSPVDPMVFLAKPADDGSVDGAACARARATDASPAFEPAFEEAEAAGDALVEALADLHAEIEEQARDL